MHSLLPGKRGSRSGASRALRGSFRSDAGAIVLFTASLTGHVADRSIARLRCSGVRVASGSACATSSTGHEPSQTAAQEVFQLERTVSARSTLRQHVVADDIASRPISAHSPSPRHGELSVTSTGRLWPICDLCLPSRSTRALARADPHLLRTPLSHRRHHAEALSLHCPWSVPSCSPLTAFSSFFLPMAQAQTSILAGALRGRRNSRCLHPRRPARIGRGHGRSRRLGTEAAR